MHRLNVKLIAACLATSALAFAAVEIQTNARAKSELDRLLAGRHDMTVSGISANVLTGRLTLSGLAVIAGPWHVSVGQLRLHLPESDVGFVSAAHAFPTWNAPDDKPAPVSPSTAARGSASAENVVITDGTTTYRLKRIDLAGTPLSNDDLAALLDPAKPDTVETRLRRLTAASINISEVATDSSVGATEQHWVQKQILLANVTQGKAAIGSVGASSVAVKSDDSASNIDIGSLQLAGVDMGQTAHVFAATRTDDGEKLMPLSDSVVANAIKVTDVKNRQSTTIGSIKEQGLKGRAFKTDLRTQSSRLSAAKPGDPAVSAFLNDLLSSVSAKLAEIDDVAVTPSTGAEPADFPTFGVEQIYVRDIGEGQRVGEMRMRNLHFEGKQGRMAMASVNIGDLSLPLQKSAAGPTATASQPDGAPADQTMPLVAKLELADLHFDMNVAAKGETEQRLAFAINHVDFSASGLEAGRLPAKSVASIGHVTYDVPLTDPSLQTLRTLGYRHLDVSSNVTSSYDVKQQTMAINKFVLGGIDMGSMELKLDLANVSDKIVSQNPEIQKASAIAVLFKDADLLVRNDGLIDKALQYRADLDGKSVEDEKKTYIDFVTNQLPLLAGGSPKLKPLEDALATFIAKPKTLHVAIAARNGLGAADVALLGDPNALLDVLDIQANAND